MALLPHDLDGALNTRDQQRKRKAKYDEADQNEVGARWYAFHPESPFADGSMAWMQYVCQFYWHASCWIQ